MSGRTSEANPASLLCRIVLLALMLIVLNGCTTLGYYGQAVSGQLSVLARARPIGDLLNDPTTAPDLKSRLTRVLAMREFARGELALPDNNSYRRYADLERPAAMWNVFATPELSLEPKRWCMLFAGCMSYHSYFSREPADREAKELRAQGYDVHVGSVVAYSTAGWFDDPVLNTMLAYPDPELAGILFHELAHQKIFVPDDTAFNESFAMAVEREGVRRWLAAHNAGAEYAGFLERARRREEFTTLTMRYRDRLDQMYRSDASDDDKRTAKQTLFDALRHDYAQWQHRQGGSAGYDRWMEQLNNARFLSVALYHQHIPAFEVLLARHGGDLPAFYRAAEVLASAPQEIRDRVLAELKTEAASTARRVGTQY